jgi:hypothetical protein
MRLYSRASTYTQRASSARHAATSFICPSRRNELHLPVAFNKMRQELTQ